MYADQAKAVNLSRVRDTCIMMAQQLMLTKYLGIYVILCRLRIYVCTCLCMYVGLCNEYVTRMYAYVYVCMSGLCNMYAYV
jgi:hypothetical protein